MKKLWKSFVIGLFSTSLVACQTSTNTSDKTKETDKSEKKEDVDSSKGGRST